MGGGGGESWLYYLQNSLQAMYGKVCKVCVVFKYSHCDNSDNRLYLNFMKTKVTKEKKENELFENKSLNQIIFN